MSENSPKIIRLKVPANTINRRKIAEAELIIASDGKVIKDRFGRVGREATEQELDEAVEVYG